MKSVDASVKKAQNLLKIHPNFDAKRENIAAI
jgi:hypothetical protein